jgi:hypothetical protein
MWLPRLFVKFGLALTLLFASVATLIQRAPYHAPALRALLLPDDCPIPCFIGIQPGVTTADEAIAILRRHPWINHPSLTIRLNNRPDPGEPGFVIWEAPPTSGLFSLRRGRLNLEGTLVTSVQIFTDITWADSWLVLGRPDQGFTELFPTGYAAHHALYRQQDMMLRSVMALRPHIHDFWSAPVEVQFGDTVSSRIHYRLPCWLGCR